MIIYSILLFASLGLGYLLKANESDSAKKTYMLIMWGAMLILSAVRAPTVGIDTMYFSRHFLAINAGAESRLEGGFVLFSRALGFISSDPQILIIVSSIIIFAAAGRFVYLNSQDVVLSTFLFISMRFFFLYMNMMRQAIAIAIILIGYEFLKKRKDLWFCVFVFLASTFHFAAVVVLPLVLFRRVKFSKLTYVLSALIAVVIYLNASAIFGFAAELHPRVGLYLGSVFDRTTLIASQMYAAVYFIIVTFAAAVMYRTRITAEQESKYIKNVKSAVQYLGFMENDDFRTRSHFYVFAMVICFFMAVMTVHALIFHRIVEYFEVWLLLLIPQTIMCIQNVRNRHIIYAFVIALGIFHFYITLIFRPWWDGILPYTAFF
ncbi:MAG: EpsG family protein [Defluviitaleaceae bacterium]|nr:EpsG family protein [Defluviitaleaceae bacterium]